MINWCQCGRPLDQYLMCPRHKDKVTKEVRKKIGKYSGPSKQKEMLSREGNFIGQ